MGRIHGILSDGTTVKDIEAKWLVESSNVPLKFFQERCEEEFLWGSEMIKIKAADLKSKEVTLLCRGSEISTPDESGAIVGIIKSLIGHFDLDPNRVFDISHASQILGFNFQYNLRRVR